MMRYPAVHWMAYAIVVTCVFSQPLNSQAGDTSSNAVTMKFSDGENGPMPSYVSHDPGFPRKPLWERPGDFNQSRNPPIRYCQEENFRAGWPSEVRKHAICSVNSRYSAWYVGGGSAWPFPLGRCRHPDEGTWGLDYSLWSRPKSVWMKWTRDREQGGLGAYETD